MRRKIYINMFILAFTGISLTTVFMLWGFFNFFNRQMETDLISQAWFCEKVLNHSGNSQDYLASLELSNIDARISIISQDGTVTFDSYQNPAPMENHLSRPEIKSAMETGQGQSTRFSVTLGERTFYYAVELHDGSILRLSKETSGVYTMMKNMLSFYCVILFANFLLCHTLALKLTKIIVKPLNNIDLTKEQNCLYEELSPFMKMITEQKSQIREQIASLEDKSNTIEAIINNMNEGLLILDHKGYILSANQSVVSLFKNGGQDFTGRNAIELIRSVDFLENIKKALKGEHSNISMTLQGKTLEVFLSPVLVNGKSKGAIALFLDITEKTQAEKIRRDFSANVSHELKTPLTVILGLSEMISAGMVKTEDISNFSLNIKDEASRLLGLIEDIIKISELDEKPYVHQKERFHLLSVAAQVIENLKSVADSKEVTVHVKGGDFYMDSNRTMIYELLYNLIENSVNYNKTGGTVHVDLRLENGAAAIHVSDTGIGIPPEHISRVFERFYRVDKSRSKKTGGTGLGLSIVKHIVQSLNGKVEMESEENVGTTVKVTMPA